MPNFHIAIEEPEEIVLRRCGSRYEQIAESFI